MQSFMVTLLICSAVMSLLILLYIACMPLLSKRYSEKGRYYAWLVIVIGLIIPFRPQWGAAIINVNALLYIQAPDVQADDIQAPTIQADDVQAPVVQSDDVQADDGASSHLISLHPIDSSASSDMTLNVTLWQITTTIWLSGVVVFIGYHSIRHYRFSKIAKRWSENIVDEEIISLFKRLKSEMRITKQIPLYLCPSVGSPMMINLIKPRILLPTIDLEHDELCFILKHELIHYKRKDSLYKYLILTATALHWFNPVVYLMAKAIDMICEASCDVEVVKNSDADMRLSYSRTIIRVVNYQSKLKTSLSTNFYGGKKDMKNRISSIMDTNKKKAGLSILCAALVFTMGTGIILAANTTTSSYQAPIISDSIDGMTSDIDEETEWSDDSEQIRQFADEILEQLSFIEISIAEVEIEDLVGAYLNDEKIRELRLLESALNDELLLLQEELKRLPLNVRGEDISTQNVNPSIQASGPVVSQTLQLGEFSGVSADAVWEVVYRQSENHSVVVEVNESILEYLNVHVQNGTLHAEFRSGFGFDFSNGSTPRIYVYAPYITELNLAGAATATDWDVLYAPELSIQTNGVGSINISVEVERLSVDSVGASHIELEGSADTAKVTFAGAGGAVIDMEIEELVINNFGTSRIELSGSADIANIAVFGVGTVMAFEMLIRDATVETDGLSSVYVNVSEYLYAKAGEAGGGISHIRYMGSPTVVSHTFGMSTIEAYN